ncbi:MAG: hypothetical protein DRJ14_08680 [Acidobacteria bacterium]|nr:MAG: hypothetical protein DRJ14_08680 [Acidobacteriota bacterium]
MKTPVCSCFRQNIEMKLIVLSTAGVCLIFGTSFFLALSHGNSNNINTTQWLNAFVEVHTEATNDSSGFLIEPTISFLVVVAIPPDPCDMCIHSMLNLIHRTKLDALDGTRVCIVGDENVTQSLRRITASLHMRISAFCDSPRDFPADHISLYFYDLRTDKCVETLSIRSENPFDNSTENALVAIKNRMKKRAQKSVDANLN